MTDSQMFDRHEAQKALDDYFVDGDCQLCRRPSSPYGEPHYHWCPIDHLQRALICIDKMEESLVWYAEKARSMARYSQTKPPNMDAMTAIVTELSLDAGHRGGRPKNNERTEGEAVSPEG